MKKYIGCDLGGTNLRAAIVDVENASVLYQMSIPTLAREGHDAVMRRMGDLFLQVIEKAGLKTFTQIADTKEGKRTRVRIGPFSQKADAEKALSKAKSLQLQATLLTF